MSRFWIFLGLAALVGGVVGQAAPAQAQSDSDAELRLMGQPFFYTDVVDAFDEDDPFDINVRLGFRRIQTSGTIRREVNGDGSDAAGGRASKALRDVADWEHIRNVLDLGVDVGLYRDVALYARMPVVLSDERRLDAPGGRSDAAVAADLEDPMGNPLFSAPFRSPTRSGIEHLSIGLAWAIFNQYRTPDVPTWVVMAEGKFNVSKPMRACMQGGQCRRSDPPRDVTDPSDVYTDGAGPGIGRGTNGLKLETRTSRRYRYVEPYVGLKFQMEWPGRADDLFAPAGDLSGFMNTLPPRIGELTAGLAVIPWENRGRWQRLAIDMRFNATYVSEGRDYSPLFDALGTSQSPYLTQPNSEGVPDGETRLRRVHFFGLTDVQSHGRIGGRLALHMQAAQYMHFALGLGLQYTTPHLLTFTDACNPNVSPQGKDDPRIGRCREGIINPHHRPVLDLPGNRFELGGALTFDLFASAIAQF